MNVTREQQKQEALRRIKATGLYEPVYIDLLENDLINRSDYYGMLFWVEDEEEKKYIENFEKQFGAYVYHVIRSATNFGEMDSLLFVSKYPEEWEEEVEMLKNGTAFVYVHNKDCEWCSEFGRIGFVEQFGGLVRTS